MGEIITGILQRDVLDILLSFARPFSIAFIGYYFMYKLIPSRLNIYGIIAIASIYGMWFIVGDQSSYLYGTNFHLWMNIFINTLTNVTVIFLYKGKLWRKVIVYWYFQIIHMMCETISFIPILLYYSHQGHYGQWADVVLFMESNMILRFLYILAIPVLFILLGFLSLRIWRKILLQKFQPFYLLFIVLPIGQMYTLTSVIHPSMGDLFFGATLFFVGDVEQSYYILAVIGATVALAASIALFYYIFSHEKKAAIEAELMETKRIMELEQAHYLEIERQSEKMTTIRHDFNTQLASIIQLVRTGEAISAQEMINDLSKEIKETE